MINEKKLFKIFLLGSFLCLISLSIILSLYYQKGFEKSNNKKIRLNIITNVDKDLLWKFSTKNDFIDAKIGQIYKIEFNVENYDFNKSSGKAIYVVEPIFFKKYFVEIDCFCYKNQTLMAGEKSIYSITFYIDTEVLNNSRANNIQNINISYTFLNNKND